MAVCISCYGGKILLARHQPANVLAVYALQCRDGKYYVGSTLDSEKRFRQHFQEGGGSIWTREYQPENIVFYQEDLLNHDEERITLEFMKEYGITNVRGGSYCRLILTQKTIHYIEDKLGITFSTSAENKDLRNCVLTTIRQLDQGKGVEFDAVIYNTNDKGFTLLDSEAMLEDLCATSIIHEPTFARFKISEDNEPNHR